MSTPVIIAMIAVCLVAVLCWLGANGDRVRELNLCFWQIPYSPLQHITEWCQNGRRSVLAWMRSQVDAESSSTGSPHIMYWIFGALIYTGLAALFLYCELGVLSQTFDSLGLPADILPETNPGSLMAIATWAAAIAWPLFLFDVVGVTHLAPWMYRFSPWMKRGFIASCILGTSLAALALGLFADYRAHIISDVVTPAASANQSQAPVAGGQNDIDAAIARLQQSASAPENSYSPPAWIPFAAFLCAQAAIIGAGIVSCNGALTLFKWIILGVATAAGFLPLALISGIFTLLQALFDRLVGFFQKCLDIAIENGQAILRNFGWKQKEDQSADSTATSNTEKPAQSHAGTASTQGGGTEAKKEEFAYRPSASGFDPMGVGAEQATL